MGKREPLSPLTKWIVLYRDNFTCQKCGKKAIFKLWPGGPEDPNGPFCDLIVHHIEGPTSNDYDNLITLCQNCHFMVHGGSWKNKPKEKFNPRPITTEIIFEGMRDYYRRQDYVNEYFFRRMFNEYEKKVREVAKFIG